MKVRIATRRSALALAQTRMVARDLCALDPAVEVEEVQIVTEGDRVQDRSLAAIGGKGLFVKELEAALLEGRADLAVHSMKDLPAALAPGLTLLAVPPRESPWDLLVSEAGGSLDALPQGARVGTSSLRRAIQLRAQRPDLDVQMLRGNVDTRLRKLREGQYDAIVLAEAGVRRLGLEVTAQRLERALVPAVGQGALALEGRAGDGPLAALVGRLNDAATAVTTRAERAVLSALGASCTVPMGAFATLQGNQLEIRGFYADPSGARAVNASVRGDAAEPERLGGELAERLSSALTSSA